MTIRISLPYTFCAIAAALFASAAGANGGFWETPQRSAGNLLAPSARFSMQKENLDIQMNATDYVVRVTYTVQDAAGQDSAMYFPVICSSNSEAAFSSEEGKNLPQGCVKRIQFIVNGQPAPAQAVSPKEVQRQPALNRLAKQLVARATHTEGGPDPEEFPVNSQFFKLAIAKNTSVSTLAVEYRAIYDQTIADSSKSPESSYDAARMIYDFLPAAAWAGQSVSALDIHIHTDKMQSAPQWNQRTWPFTVAGNDLKLSIPHPDFAKLPPLVLRTDNNGYQNHTALMQQIKAGDAHYSITVLQAQASQTGHDNVAALFDGKPDSFWCWRGPRATLLLEAPTGLIIPEAPQTEHGKAPVLHYYPLWTFGILPGAVASKSTFDQYGLPKTISVRVKGGAPNKQAASGNDELPLVQMLGDQDRYKSYALFGELDISASPAVDEDKLQLSNRKTIPRKAFVITVSQVHKRSNSDESCISELYPVYHAP